MSHKNTLGPSLCNDCIFCVTLNSVKGQITTEHFSGEPYSWDKFTEPLCKKTATGMRNVSKCSAHEKKPELEAVN